METLECIKWEDVLEIIQNSRFVLERVNGTQFYSDDQKGCYSHLYVPCSIPAHLCIYY